MSWMDESKAVSKLYSVMIVAASIVVPVLAVWRVALNFRNLYYMSHAEGAWMTSAYDFTHGVLYRPLFGPLGYGGTRFFPLYIVVTGSLSRIFGRLEDSGMILSAASVLLLACGCFVVLRRLDVSALLSLGAATAVLTAGTTQEALVHTKGDGLAAMLNVWGLALCAGSNQKEKRGCLYVAALLFSLAFAAKMTMVFGAAAVICAWAFDHRTKDALRLGVAAAVGYVVVVSAMYFGSGGRVLEIFRVCAGGGGSLTYALGAPYRIVGSILDSDPTMLVFLVPAAAFGLSHFKKFPAHILPIYFVFVLAVTTMIFGSPGTLFNHLIDLNAAAILLLAYSASRNVALTEIGAGIIAFGLIVGCAGLAGALHNDFEQPSLRAEIQTILERIPRDGRPILAENSFVVLQSGKSPYMLDPFMFRVATSKYPALGTDLWQKLSHRDFAAVVLERDPEDPAGEKWYREVHFGGEFLQDLKANYSFSYSVGNRQVYIPKSSLVPNH
jgi:hypothetical protein